MVLRHKYTAIAATSQTSARLALCCRKASASLPQGGPFPSGRVRGLKAVGLRQSMVRKA